jgi:hypothetical protein
MLVGWVSPLRLHIPSLVASLSSVLQGSAASTTAVPWPPGLLGVLQQACLQAAQLSAYSSRYIRVHQGAAVSCAATATQGLLSELASLLKYTRLRNTAMPADTTASMMSGCRKRSPRQEWLLGGLDCVM